MSPSIGRSTKWDPKSIHVSSRGPSNGHFEGIPRFRHIELSKNPWLPVVNPTPLRYRHTGRSQRSSRKVRALGKFNNWWCLWPVRSLYGFIRKWLQKNCNFKEEMRINHAFFPVLFWDTTAKKWGIYKSIDYRGFPEFLQRKFLTPLTWMFHTKDDESVCAEESKYESRVHGLFSSGIQFSCFNKISLQTRVELFPRVKRSWVFMGYG